MAGIFTLSLKSYILTVGLWDCGTAVAGIFTLSLMSHILTVGRRDCGGKHFHSFTHVSYTDCGTAVAGMFRRSLIIHQLLDSGGTMTTGPRTAVFRTQRSPSGPVL